MIRKLYSQLHKLRLDNGLYIAADGDHYKRCWLRDMSYCVMPELKNNPEYYKQTYQSILDYFHFVEKKYNNKITRLLDKTDFNPSKDYEFIHPRFNCDFTEIDQPWGYRQWDAWFIVIYGIAIGEQNGINIIRNQTDVDMINLLLKIADKHKFYLLPESGIWENEQDIRSSTLAAMVAGMREIQKVTKYNFKVSKNLEEDTKKRLYDLFPNETSTRQHDLALLTLIFPFDVLDNNQAKIIIKNIEDNLLRENGVIRHKGDWYYNRANKGDMDRFGFSNMYVDGTFDNHEAEWVFGFLFLALAHHKIGNIEKTKYYLNKVLVKYPDGSIPELCFAHTDIPNDNKNLCWAIALVLVLLEKLESQQSDFYN